MKLVLLGNSNTKRIEYFRKAAQELGQKITVQQLPALTHLRDFDYSRLSNCVVKVDPLPLEQDSLDELNTVMNLYHDFLLELGRVPGIRLLNSCDALWQTLDKLICKQRLERAGLPVTTLLADSIDSLVNLQEMMYNKRVYQVFVKPRLGSGAAGVIAFRLNPQTGGAMMETSCRLAGGRLYNTNKLRKTSNANDIQEVINRLLEQGAIVERWIPKETHQGQAYDLRAVFQFGRMEYIVARCSRGSITNLHLNDSALPMASLNFSHDELAAIDSLCREAVALFPGLNVAGIDILLEKHSMKPMIIEINGHGDLIYQDIFAENRIYRAQVKAMLSL